MIIAGVYSFNGGKDAVEAGYRREIREIKRIISEVDSRQYKTKVSREKTMPGRILFQPGSLNKAFRAEFEARGWRRHKVPCEYPQEFYVPGFASRASPKGAFREIDFVKNRLGVEVQFGKYAFMVYNVARR